MPSELQAKMSPVSMICLPSVPSPILQLLKLPDGTVKVLIEGRSAGSISSFDTDGDHHRPRWRPSEPKRSGEHHQEALLRVDDGANLISYVQASKKIPAEVLTSVRRSKSPARLVRHNREPAQSQARRQASYPRSSGAGSPPGTTPGP